jgi:hypothetical protein
LSEAPARGRIAADYGPFQLKRSASALNSLLKNREIWGSSALVLNLAVMIEISSPGMARGFLSVFAVFA